MTKIRIGFYTDATGFGGADIILRQILENIDHSRFEPLLFCHRKYPLEKAFKSTDKFKVIYIEPLSIDRSPHKIQHVLIQAFKEESHRVSRNFLKTLLYPLLWQRQVDFLTELFKPYNLDIFHHNDVVREPDIIAAQKAGIPIVIGTYHIMPPPLEWNLIKRFINLHFEKESAQNLTKAIVVSNNVRDLWIKRLGGNPDKFVTILNSVDTSKIVPDQTSEDVKSKYDIPDDAIVVGVTARLHPGKGHLFLIEAAQNIIKRFKNVIFVLVGEGHYRGVLEEKVEESNLKEHFRFTGYVNNQYDFMQLYDIAVLPSYKFEAFGLANLEAMFLEKPIVSSNLSGIPEVVADGETGVLVPPCDSIALANAIIELLENPEKRRKMGKAGRRKGEEVFAQEKMLSKTFELYEQLIQESKINK